MINFRFHLISLIAVFLALAIGVVMGYAVLGSPTVDTLQNRVNSVEARADRIRAENGDLRREVGRLRTVIEETDEFAVTERLTGANTIVVATVGVDEDQVRSFVRLARRSGASVPGIIWLEPEWALPDADAAADLAPLVGASTVTRPAAREIAADALAARLTTGPAPTGRPDLLRQLADAGFLRLEEVDDVRIAADTVDGRNARLVLVGGNGSELRADRALVPLATSLARAGALLVVADEWSANEKGRARGEHLAAIRDDDELAAAITTVDHFDLVDGPLVTVLALGQRIQGTVAHYGFGKGADRAVPEWWGV